ncbi:MAG: pilus assembly PilX N-terminal domain-containing protein [Pseudomonadota bacterium]
MKALRYAPDRHLPGGRGEKGTALVLSLFLITVLTVLGTMVLNTSIVEIKMAQNQKISSQVFYAAEAGLERGILMLIKDYETDTSAGAPWGNSNFAGWAETVTESTNAGTATFDPDIRSMDMYLNSNDANLRKLTLSGGNTVNNTTFDLYLYRVSSDEVYVMSHASGNGGVAAVEYHLLSSPPFSPLDNAIFTNAGITGHFQGSVDLAGSIYSRGNVTPTGALGFYNNYADAAHGLGALAGVIPDETDLDAYIRVKGGDFTLGGSAQVGTANSNGAYSGIQVDGTTNALQGVNAWSDEYSSDVPDVPLPSILDGLNTEFGEAFVDNCITVGGCSGTDAEKAKCVYEQWAEGTGCFPPGTTTGVVINSDINIDKNTGPFNFTDGAGNGLIYDGSGNVTIQGTVVINGSFDVGDKSENMTYVAVGAAYGATASDVEAGATLFVRDDVGVNGPFLGDGGYCQGGAGTNSLGVITPGTVTFTGNPGDAYTGYYYAETQVNFNKQAKFGGTVMGGVVNFAQVPDVFQVPSLMDYAPPAIPGSGQVGGDLTSREWRRVY